MTNSLLKKQPRTDSPGDSSGESSFGSSCNVHDAISQNRLFARFQSLDSFPVPQVVVDGARVEKSAQITSESIFAGCVFSGTDRD